MRAFLAANGRWLAAGVVMTFASSFGQTFFISLFGAEIRSEYGLSDGAFGGIYTLGTLASAALLTAASSLTDHFRARTVAIAILVIYAGVCLCMAVSTSPVFLIFVIFGLRFCGQGMMSQIAMTAMGRWFNAQRGKAVAVAGLGFSLGEAVLPTVGVSLMMLFGWRTTWVIAAGFLLLVAPILMRLLSAERTPQQLATDTLATGLGGRHWTRSEAIRHWMFLPLTIGVLGPPLIGTALFFQQARLAEVKDLSLASIALAYPFYSLLTIAFSLITGWLVDRFGARTLLPVYQLPMAAGALLLSTGNEVWIIWLVFALFGVTQGGAVAILGALWPELYGTRHIGAIRGLAIAAMVFSTALGPGTTGYLLDAGVSLDAQFIGFGIAQILICGGFVLLVIAAVREDRALDKH